ncbi:MAG TPA: hypothetical protein VD905_07770, partial [Flavobacteriales bacterium]|nr:hypothetical protein [Flavobacteriales bacterium]
MKGIITGLGVLLSICATAQVSDYIETNALKAKITTLGRLFSFPTYTAPSFEAPKNSGKNTFYFSNLWIGGEDAFSQIHLCANQNDFQYGPLSDTTALVSTSAASWDKIWKVTTNDISYHIANYMTIGYVPSAAIANWPGNGQTAL